MRNMRIAERLFNRPLMIHEAHLNTIEQVFSKRIGLNLIGVPDVGLVQVSEDQRREYGYKVVNGLGIIDIHGPLMHRVMEMEFPSGGPTTYADIRRAFDMAMADDEVFGVVGIFGTGGGEVSGVFDTADHIFNSRGIKPLTAIVDEEAYSAGYLLASSFDRVIIPRTGGVGSIGVIATHTEFSRWEEENGITVKHIYAGARKADYSPHIPLSAEAEDALQEKVDDNNKLFVETVARNRALKVKAIVDMQASTYEGKKAVDAKLADQVSPVDKAIASAKKSRGTRLIAASAQPKATRKENKMVTIEELREQEPDLVAQIENQARQGMISQADAATAQATAVKSEAEAIMALVTAAVGESVAKRITMANGKGLSASDLEEMGISLSVVASGQSTEQQMLAAISSAASTGVKGSGGKIETKAVSIDTAAIYASRQEQVAGSR